MKVMDSSPRYCSVPEGAVLQATPATTLYTCMAGKVRVWVQGNSEP